MFYLVCFDIVQDRTRARVVKVLSGYGHRVQKSVFECPRLTEKQFVQMKHRIDDLIDQVEDTVRFYFLCQGCLRKVEWVGFDDGLFNSAFDVV